MVAIFKKDVATLSQRLQCILLKIHQYRERIIYKPGPDLFVADWLSKHYHKENKDEEILGMNININAICMATDIPNFTSAQEIQQASVKDDHWVSIIEDWPEIRNEGPQEITLYWTFRDHMAVIDDIILKGSQIVIPKELQKHVWN